MKYSCIGSLHFLQHPVTAMVLSSVMKQTVSTAHFTCNLMTFSFQSLHLIYSFILLCVLLVPNSCFKLGIRPFKFQFFAAASLGAYCGTVLLLLGEFKGTSLSHLCVKG